MVHSLLHHVWDVSFGCGMTKFKRLALVGLGLMAVASVSPVLAQEPVVVGGITPAIRPAGSPSIHGVHNGMDWYRQALKGVDQPYPQSLVWLDRQGEWYTPFSRPGMPGPYDIRGWHNQK